MPAESTGAFPHSKAFSGISWELGGSVFSKGFKFVVSILLARILVPADFGMLAMGVICLGFLELFLELGMTTALAQRETLHERHRSTAFWMTASIGLGLTVCLCFLSSFIADFFEEPRLTPVLMVLSLDLFFSGVHVAHRGLLRRAMNFDTKARIQVIAVAMAGTIAVIMAYRGWGVWSLVMNFVGLTLLEAVGYWWGVGWVPAFCFDREAFQELWEVAGGVTSFGILNFLVNKTDDLLIGRFQGSGVLGLYTRAYSLMTLPAREFTYVLGRVMMPAFARIQDDREELKRLFLKANRLIALITLPAVLGLMLSARSFVVGVLGPHWEAAVPFLQLLCLEGLKKPIQSTAGWVFEATGETWLQFRWGLVYGLSVLGAFSVGIFWGAWGIAVAYVLVHYLLWYPHVRVVGDLIDMTFREHVVNLADVALGTLFMGIVLIVIDVVWLSVFPPLYRLLSKVLVGFLAYLGFLHLSDVQSYREGWELVHEMLTVRDK